MAFTYVDTLSTNRDKVRFLVQDTDSTRPLLTDDEIAFLIAEWADVYDAAANAADILAAKFAGKADYSKSVGDLSLNETFSSQASSYKELSKSIRLNRYRRYTVSWVANAEALKSTANRSVDTYNTDAYLGQMDNPRTSNTEEMDQ